MKLPSRLPAFPTSLRPILLVVTCLLSPSRGSVSSDVGWVTDQEGKPAIQFQAGLGYEFLVQRSRDLRVWTTKETFPGLGQSITLQVPTPDTVSGTLSAYPSYMFSITPDENNIGMTYITWHKGDGQMGRVYDALDFSWHDTIPLSQTNVLNSDGSVAHAVLLHKVERDIPANGATFPPSSLDAADTIFYQRLVNAHPQIVAELTNSSLQTYQSGTVAGSASESHFYRVIARALDSDDDELSDLLEASPGFSTSEFPTSPYDSDTDSDAITDPWDRGHFTDVIISEFMATNDNTHFDEDGDDSDWIELFNPTDQDVDLSGWTLEDGDDLWTFPDALTEDPSEQLVLAPGELLLIFASEKNRRDPAAPLHTNFKLGAGGDRITLRKPATSGGFLLVDEHDFGEQRKNTSGGWAFDPGDGSFPTTGGRADIRYFVDASPGRTNPPSTCPGLCQAPNVFPQGGLFPSGSGSVTVSMTAQDPVPPTLIYYSLDGSNPDAESFLYTGPFQVSESTVVRAVALQNGCDPSPITARSYLFTDSIVGTAAPGQEPIDHQERPATWPGEAVGVPSGEEDRQVIGELDFALDPVVIASLRTEIEQELLQHPVVSISGSIGQLFGLDSGFYANSSVSKSQPDPLENDWQRLISIEYFDPAATFSYVQENAEITVTGDSSRGFGTTAKHNLRLRFRSRFSRTGRASFEPSSFLFPGSNVVTFKELLLRNPTQDSWLLKWAPGYPRIATYVRSGWMQSLHAKMGEVSGEPTYLQAHRRWVHVFLNGLYWGAYELTERVDEHFAKSYVDSNDDYDVFKYSGTHAETLTPEAADGLISGSYEAWSVLRAHCQAAALDPSDAAKWQAVQNYLDLENYHDYLLVQMYANVRDWFKNFRIVRRKGEDEVFAGNPTVNPGGKFRFVVWDAEFSLNEGNPPTLDQVDLTTGAAEFHAILRDHPDYRQAFRGRVGLHFRNPGGLMTPGTGGGLNGGYQLLQNEMDRFGGIRDGSGTILVPGVISAESARWGDGNPDLTRSVGYDDAPEYGPGWKSRVEALRDGYDGARRQTFLDALDALGLLNP